MRERSGYDIGRDAGSNHASYLPNEGTYYATASGGLNSTVPTGSQSSNHYAVPGITYSGDITIKKTSDDVVFETIPVGDARVTGGGSTTITINPSGLFTAGVGYYVMIDATGFKDAYDNYYAGIAAKTTWNFTAVSNPVVSDFSPDDDSTDVPIDKDLIITFDMAVDAESGYIKLYKTTGDILIQSFNVETDISGSGSTTITANPTSNLDYSTDYYIKIDATAFDDAASNSYAGISDETTWNFTTEDISEDTKNIYYSVGTNVGSLYSNNGSASVGVLTLSSAASDNIGVGDEIR